MSFLVAADGATAVATGQQVAVGLVAAGAGGVGATAIDARVAGAGTATVEASGREVEQYALRAIENGFYPVMQRGFSQPQGGIFLRAGEVWKYGITQNPATRHSQSFLVQWNLRYDTMMAGTRVQALSAENAMITTYLRTNEVLPPGNKIIR